MRPWTRRQRGNSAERRGALVRSETHALDPKIELVLGHLLTREHAPNIERLHSIFEYRERTTDAPLDQLAAEDPIMASALQQLDALSMDPNVRRLANERAGALGWRR